ncbi:MAG TPA: hypothetical protein VGD54_02080 [Steroidobacteraceae bacterium]
MQASGDGFWELDLVGGSAWFSDWFSNRLNWPDGAKRLSLSDLRPALSAETWDALLRQLRSHLEERTPLDVEFQVQPSQGEAQRWHMRGSAPRTDLYHPTHFAGSVRDVSAVRSSPDKIA